MSIPAAKHIEQLTWLRGFAAFLVIISHTLRVSERAYAATDTPSHFPLFGHLDLGSFGVMLFFALSGCTLFISDANKKGVENIHGFYAKRFFRIWPAYIVSLVMYVLFVPVFRTFYGAPANPWLEHELYISYSLQDLFHYALLIFNITGPAGLFNSAYWSMPIEFQYYLLFPLLVCSLRLGAIGPLLIGLAIYELPLLHPVVKGFEFFNMAFVFCAGVMLGHLYTRSGRRIDIHYALGAGLLGLAFVAELRLGRLHIVPALPGPPYPMLYAWYGITAILITAALLFSRAQAPAKLAGFLRNYGEISYSTYLYHNLFIGIAVLIVRNAGIYGGNLKLCFVFLFTLVTSYVAAKISYRYIESPSIQYGRKLARSLAKEKAPMKKPIVIVVALAVVALFVYAVEFAKSPTSSAPATDVSQADLAKAEKGDATTQYNLGVTFYQKKDFAQAAKWYGKAADQGNVHAYYSLGNLYNNGQGVTKNPTTANEWYRKGAVRGDADSQFALGLGYLHGGSLSQDFSQAYYWLLLSTNAGETSATTARDEAASHLTPQEIDDVKQRAQNFKAQ